MKSLILTSTQAASVYSAMVILNDLGLTVVVTPVGRQRFAVSQFDDGSIIVESQTQKPGPYPTRESYKDRQAFWLAYFGSSDVQRQPG